MRFSQASLWLSLPVIGSCASAGEGFSLASDPVTVALNGESEAEAGEDVELIDPEVCPDEADTGGTDEPPGGRPRHDDRDDTGAPSRLPPLPPDDTGRPGGHTSPPPLPTDTGIPNDEPPPSDTDDTASTDTGEPDQEEPPHDTEAADTADSGFPSYDTAPTDPLDDSAVYETGTPGADVDSADPDSAGVPVAEPEGERCDGIDNDLDGLIDEDAYDAVAWYTDVDGDGIGGDLSGVGCTAPQPGDSTEAGDCDDSSVLTHPGAIETCDGADNDCDLVVDNEAVDAPTWYADLDGDGYGDNTNAYTDCFAPEGYVSVALDCDDGSADVSPEGVETCNSLDDDCSGAPDDNGGDCAVVVEPPDDDDTGVPSDTGVGEPPLDTGSWDPGGATDTGEAEPPVVEEEPVPVPEECTGYWYQDFDVDGYGDVAVAVEGCSPGEGWVRNDDDCDDLEWSTSPAAAELCDGVDNDCDGLTDENDAIDAPPRYLDVDGDGYGRGDVVVRVCDVPSGYVAVAGDCDDADAAISPGAVEYCDGIDNDCGEGIDEVSAVDAPSWFMDVDGDGYAGELTRTACLQPDDTYTTSEDCDDGDALISPVGIEVCNDTDDDCNGIVDDDEATGAGWWFVDADEDDYGDIATATWSCSSIEGYVQNSDDCDDANSGAAPLHRELCDGYDNDCDGETDELGSSGETVWYADVDADGYGDRWSKTEACDVPAGFVSGWGDCDDADGAANPGVAEVCGDRVDNDCDGVSEPCGPWGDRDLSAADMVWTGEFASDDAGRSVAFVPDTDGDGYDDVLVGAPQSDFGGTEGGSVYVLRGAPDGGSLGLAPARLFGESGADLAGFAIAGLDDVDGDGLGDVLVGAYKDGLAGTEAGAVFLTSGGFSGSAALDDARLILTGAVASDWAGYSVAALGDATGDGVDDVLVGAPYEDSAGSKSGAAYVVSTSHTGTRSLSSAEATFYGEVSLDRAGTALGTVGDLDGDGIDDLGIGAWGDSTVGSRSGAAYLIFGPVSGAQSLSTADAKWRGVTAGNRAGWSISGGGDLDGDGADDALIGAPYAGKAYVVGAEGTGTNSLSTAKITFVGAESSGRAGTTVAAGGDFDGDGYADALIGATGDDVHGIESGSVYVVAGPHAASVDLDEAEGVLSGNTSRDTAGSSLAGNGDVNGDGRSDVLIGAPGDDTEAGDAGAVAFFYGWTR